MYKEYNFAILSIFGTAIVVALFFVPMMITNNQATAASTPFALQDTKVSGPDPTPGHGDQHQAINVLPQRNDTKIYTGTLTYTSSTPVEVIVTHPFNLTQPSNATTTSSTPGPLTVPGQILQYQYYMNWDRVRNLIQFPFQVLTCSSITGLIRNLLFHIP